MDDKNAIFAQAMLLYLNILAMESFGTLLSPRFLLRPSLLSLSAAKSWLLLSQSLLKMTTHSPLIDIDGVRLYCGDARDVLQTIPIPVTALAG